MLVLSRHLLCVLSIILCCELSVISAQSTSFDYQPQYENWNDSYQIDKLIFSNGNLTLYLRFVKDNNDYTNYTFYPAQSEFAWVLEDEAGNYYTYKSLKNIRGNGTLLERELGEKEKIIQFYKKGLQKNTFTCEIHFTSLPSSIKKVSLIEGKNFKSSRDHLNFLNIDLANQQKGSAASEQKSVNDFNQKNQNKPSEIKSNTNKDDKNPVRQPKDISTVVDWSKDIEQYQDETTVIQENPSFKQINPDYSIDKIIHTEKETIFCCKFIFSPNASSETAVFYPVGHEDSWFIKHIKNGQKIPIQAVTQIRRNGKMEYKLLEHFPFRLDFFEKETTIITCLVHFKKLPNKAKKVHLIEGTGKASNLNYFNFFNVEIEH